ncbi:hypothetical protein EI427_11230 [Flammeovirga pectinis]|uniref:Uncharacterized protein n=1 Tax=Flammeovirga pectinis TaxID=2494373 RepID=A0A3S9P3K9_9BACT|nr:hypothetical protein [Flammeovirga pectinis]AZQ62783.1 hypothetical protein EI427_11230 [Flammeovirga pectinis]
MESKFNIRRIGLLFKYELALLQHPITVGIIGIVVFILAISALASSIEPWGIVNKNTLGSIYGLMLMLGGAVISSYSFHRVSTKGGALNYLSLPASREEKFLVTFVSTAIIYPLGLTVVFILTEFLATGIWMIIGGNFIMFTLSDMVEQEGLAEFMGSYLFMHAFYFLGAALFKKYAFLKTTVSFFAVSFVLWILGVALFFAFFSNGQFDNTSFDYQFDSTSLEGTIKYIVRTGAVAVTIAMWGIAFLKFKRKEV